jgi:hypothetical protein
MCDASIWGLEFATLAPLKSLVLWQFVTNDGADSDQLSSEGHSEPSDIQPRLLSSQSKDLGYECGPRNIYSIVFIVPNHRRVKTINQRRHEKTWKAFESKEFVKIQAFYKGICSFGEAVESLSFILLGTKR